MEINKLFRLSKSGFLYLSIVAYAAQAQDNVVEEVYVTGIRASLEKATDIKRESSGVVDAISAEDIGKFPDTNLAESLQRISGVSISRSGGEGNEITVRGLGPQFNAVTLNGRSMPSPNTGRGFRFDTIAAEMVSGVDVYKTSSVTVHSGGIGATVNVKTARPLEMADKIAGSAKMLVDVDASSTTPAVSGLFSKRINDNFGILGAVSYQERETQTDYVEVRAWNDRETITTLRGWGDPRLPYQNGEVPVRYYPTQTALGRETESRERLNGSMTMQYSPTEALMVTLDANYSDLVVEGNEMESAYWFDFNNNNTSPASMSDKETLTRLELESLGLDMFRGAPETHFVIGQIGLNIEWNISDSQTIAFDYATTKAEQNPDQEMNVNSSDIQAIPLDMVFETRSDVTTHFYDSADISLANARLHQHDGYSNNNIDELDQTKIDYTLESDMVTLRAGIMFTDQTKKVSSYNTNKGPDGSENGRAYSFRGYFPLVGSFDTDWDGDGDVYETATYNGLFDSVEEAKAAGYGVETINHAFVGDISFIKFDPKAAYSWVDTLKQKPGFIGFDLIKQPDWYEINEKTLSAYIELTTHVELADRPLTLVAGTRIENTAIDSTSLESTLTKITPIDSNSTTAENMQRTFSDKTPYTDGDDYDIFLPSMSLKYELTDDLVLRFASSRTITRPELSSMRSSRNFGDIRDDGNPGSADAGNPDLKPYVSDNLDLSVEWYLDETSYLSAGYFQKTVDNYIITQAKGEVIEGVINPITGKDVVYNINRPYNQDVKKVQGAELAAQYSFADTGFGVIANATFSKTDKPFETDQIDSSAFIGLSDSANLIGFYDNNGIQARIAYNWRDSFVTQFGHTYTTVSGEPTQTEAYGQIDLSASYDLTDSLTVFFEGINIASEETHNYSRFKEQFLYARTNSARYALGIRAAF